MGEREHSGRGVLTDWPEIIDAVTRELLGEPSASNARELRYGRRGSLSVQLDKGAWFDHEKDEGGGVIELVMRERSCSWGEALAWLEDGRYIEPGTRCGAPPPPPNTGPDHREAWAVLLRCARYVRRVVRHVIGAGNAIATTGGDIGPRSDSERLKETRSRGKAVPIHLHPSDLIWLAKHAIVEANPAKSEGRPCWALLARNNRCGGQRLFCPTRNTAKLALRHRIFSPRRSGDYYSIEGRDGAALSTGRGADMKHVVFVAALLVSLLSPATPAATIEEIEAEIARRKAAEKETNPFTAKRESDEKKRAKAKALQEELIEARKPFLNAAIEASEKIGNSPEIDQLRQKNSHHPHHCRRR